MTANASQTIAKAAKPITDATGRLRYIVDIIDDEIGKPEKFNDADSKIKYHKDKSDKLIADVAKIRGVEVIATISLVGISFVAYLDAKQQYVRNNINKLPDFEQSNPALWNSGIDFPPNYTLATFNFGNPLTAAPPLEPFQGYQWKLTCRNSDDTKTTVMYGQQ